MLDLLLCLRALTDIKYLVVIVGDTNLPNTDWESISGPNDKIYKPFIDFVNDLGLNQFVREITRKLNILDVVLSNDAFLVCDCNAGPPLGFSDDACNPSDHNTVFFHLQCDSCSAKKQDFAFVRDFKNADYVAFNNYLLFID